jgi:hypothetical protein
MTTQDYWILNNGIIKFITHLKGWEQDDEWCDKFYEMYNPEEWGVLNGFEDNRKEEEDLDEEKTYKCSDEECDWCGGDESEEDKIEPCDRCPRMDVSICMSNKCLSDDVVFCCKGCDKAIVMDSEDHNFAKCDEDNEDDWYCMDCPVPTIDDDEKTYKCSDCNEWVTSTEECCGGDESEEDKLDIKVLGFKTTDRLDGDWNSLLFEIRNQEIISVSDEIIKKKKIIKKKIIKKGLTNEEKKIKEDIRLMYDYNLPVKEARKVEDLLNQLNFDSLFT